MNNSHHYWYSPTKNEPKPKTNIDEQDNKNETIHPNLSFDTPQERTSFQPPETPKPTIPIYPDIRDNTKQKTFAQNNLTLRIPEAPSIPQPLEFAKALRPLMQKVSSEKKRVSREKIT